MMRDVQVPVVGESATSRSRQFSPQSTVNLYPEATPGSRSNVALMCWPGVIGKAYSPYGANFTDGINRGVYVFKNELYEVRDEGLYKITNTSGTLGYQGATSYGNPTRIGQIYGTGRCVFADDGVTMVIVADQRVYQYDGTTFSEIIDPNLDDPNAVAFINNQWIYDGLDGGVIVSNVGTPGTFNPLNYATAEALGDDLIRP